MVPGEARQDWAPAVGWASHVGVTMHAPTQHAARDRHGLVPPPGAPAPRTSAGGARCGAGLLYSYVDLALLRPDEATPRIRHEFRGGRMKRRAWILFFDDEYADGWVGIWDDTPPPPV